MPNPMIGMLGASVGGSVLQGKAAKSAAGNASAAQLAAAQMQTKELRRQFNTMRKLQQPYMQAGNKAMRGVMNLYGMNGAQKQQNALNRIENSPEMAMMVQQGEDAILANASATGGLRGGDTQGALAQFRPQVLNQLVQQRLAGLTGLTGMGQNAAAGVGNAGLQTGANIAGAYGQMGAAQAGNYLAQGQANSDMWGGIAGSVGNLMGQQMGGNMPGGLLQSWGF